MLMYVFPPRRVVSPPRFTGGRNGGSAVSSLSGRAGIRTRASAIDALPGSAHSIMGLRSWPSRGSLGCKALEGIALRWHRHQRAGGSEFSGWRHGVERVRVCACARAFVRVCVSMCSCVCFVSLFACVSVCLYGCLCVDVFCVCICLCFCVCM